MKYMGHKGKLLPILGEVLKSESSESAQIADPFCGSAAVSWYLAQATEKSILSGDLQSFAVARAAAVVERTSVADYQALTKKWFRSAKSLVEKITSRFPNAERSIKLDALTNAHMISAVKRSREFCHSVLPPLLEKQGGNFPMSLAYGGHYFSPLQALELDALRQTIPHDSDYQSIAIASLVEAASLCAAAPGHTAQPFQPTTTSAEFIIEAWNRNVWNIVQGSVASISSVHARVKGSAIQGDYLACIDRLDEGDLVFADPPYSDVHYSRFYHVLETLTRGLSITATGAGRYPPLAERPSSAFSRKGAAKDAAKALIDACAGKRVGLVLTFPTKGASNGLKIADFIDHGRERFSSIEVIEVNSTFSTLGGSSANRGGRKMCPESIVCFRV